MTWSNFERVLRGQAALKESFRQTMRALKNREEREKFGNAYMNWWRSVKYKRNINWRDGIKISRREAEKGFVDVRDLQMRDHNQETQAEADQ